MTKNEMDQVLSRVDEAAAKTRRHFDDKAGETQRHFDVVAEGLRSQIQTVAEGHQALAAGQARIEERFGSLENRIDRLESEIKAMLRLSFVELERRVLGLEATVTTLVGRVERLESSHS
jgi:uncharacterized protein involved in exopolysaccharide biosynthesis